MYLKFTVSRGIGFRNLMDHILDCAAFPMIKRWGTRGIEFLPSRSTKDIHPMGKV